MPYKNKYKFLLAKIERRIHANEREIDSCRDSLTRYRKEANALMSAHRNSELKVLFNERRRLIRWKSEDLIC